MEWQSPWPTNRDLRALYAIDSVTVWASGDAGTVIRTQDGGGAWERIETGARGRNNDVFFLDQLHGWIASDSGIVLRTTDGGEDWEAAQMPTTWPVLRVTFGTALTGWARVQVSGFFRSGNGGLTWEALATPNFVIPDFFAFDSLNIAAITVGTGDTNGFARSFDGGYTWVFQNLPPDHRIVDIEFADSLHGWASGFILGSPSNGLFFRSFDGGQSWTQSGDSIASPDFANAREGMAYGPNYLTFALTSDSGNTWQLVDRPQYDYALRLAYGGSGSGWLAGDVGHIHGTFDGAQSWADQSPGPRSRLDEVKFVNDQDGWCAGEDGIVMRTQNGGQDWDRINIDSTEHFYGLDFLDDLHGILAAYSGHIFYTADGGATWQNAPELITTPLWAVSGIGATACAVGWAGNVLKSMDYGATWQIHQTNPDYFLDAIQVIDESTLYVGGGRITEWPYNHEPRLLRSTNGGETWDSIDVDEDIIISDIEFIDAMNGWLSGYSPMFKMILFTNDAGLSWSVQYSSTSSFVGVLLRYNDSTLVTSGGLYTTNNGDTWIEQPAITDLSLRDLSWAGNTDICGVGELGTIIRFDPEVGGAFVSQPRPIAYQLDLQIYPNPCNSSATVKFALPVAMSLDLAIYDLQGRRVQEIGKPGFAPGQHFLHINTPALPSGSYFLTAKADNSFFTRRILIIR